jgi:type VI secretion system protein ImpJ
MAARWRLLPLPRGFHPFSYPDVRPSGAMEICLSPNRMELPEVIEWHEGMLLTPQHFQQFAERAELLTQIMHSRTGGFAWGVLDLKIDEAALAGGVVRVIELEAILPDGLFVSARRDRGVDLEFNLAEAKEDITRIYLSVPKGAALYERSDYRRYESVLTENDLSQDSVSGAAPTVIPRIRPRLQLVAGSALNGALTLPLMEFAREGTLCKPSGYIAPTPCVREGSPFADFCAPISKLVRDKATALSMRLSPNARNSDLAGLHQFQCLVSALPPVEAAMRSNGAHPYSLYLALCAMAGSVAFLSSARVPPVFPAYDHFNLRGCFGEVLDFIRQALAEGLVDNWLGKEFRLVRHAIQYPDPVRKRNFESCFELLPNPVEAFGDDADFSAPYWGLILRAPTGASAEPLVEWGESCLLASHDAIDYLEKSRSPGAVCERVDSLEEITPLPGSVLFRVKNDPSLLDPRKKLILKPAKQEMYMPASATLFVRQRPSRRRDA